MDRKLRMGMVGGGPGAFIGDVHRKAARMDGGIELVAGAFDIVPKKSRGMGRELCIDKKRVYADVNTMIETECALPEDQRIDFVDIAAVDFNAEAYDKQAEEFQKKLHACDAEGHFFTGVEAFRRLWEALPSPVYPLLSTVIGLPGIHLMTRVGYAAFARFRHFVPSNHATSCPITKNQKRR